MKIKHIILTANTSWYLLNFRASTIKAFQALGYKVVCVSPLDDYAGQLQRELNVIWIEVKLDNQGSNPIKDLGFAFQLFKVFKRFKPVAVFNFTIKNNVYGTWAAKMARVRVINNVSGLGTAFINTGLTSFIVRCLYRLSQPLADKVFCQNQEDYQLLIDKKLVPKSKLSLLPGSGVNIHRFSPELLKNRDQIFVFLYVGRMLADKGLHELINAGKLLFDKGYKFHINLCGFSGAKNSSAISDELLAEWSNLPFVSYLGPSNEIEKVYSASNCVVLPSYREGMPRSLLEAGAMGLPSITTDVPGCRNIVSHGYNGLLCELKSAEDLFVQMGKVLDMDNEEFNRLGKNARKRVVESFDEKLVVEKAIDAIGH